MENCEGIVENDTDKVEKTLLWPVLKMRSSVKDDV